MHDKESPKSTEVENATNLPISSLHFEDEGASQKVTFRVVLVLVAVLTGYVASLVHIIGSGLLAHSIVQVVGGADKVAWITIALTINAIVLGPPAAQAADFWGRKIFIVVGTSAGVVGCIIVSRSNSIGMVLAGQSIAGLAQTCQGLIHAITSEVLPRKYRGWAQGTIHITASLTAVVALYTGGAMCRHNPAGFRNYWYFAAAVFFVTSSVIALFYKPPTRELQHLTLLQKLHRLDIPGCLLLATALLGVCLGLGYSQNPYGWNDAHVLAPFIIGICGLLGMVIYATYFKKDGLIHHGVIRSRNFALAMVCFLGEGVAFFAANNYLGFQLSVVYGTDLLESGIVYSIAWYAYLVSAIFAGWIISRTRRVKAIVLLSFVLFIIFFSLMASTKLGSKTNIWGYTLFLGLGLGICLNGLVTVAQLSTPAELIAPATGLMIAARSCGGTVGLAIYNAVFNAGMAHLGANISRAALSHGLPPSSLGSLIPALAANNQVALEKVPGINREIIQASVIALKETYNLGFRNIYITAAAFSAMGLISSLFLTDRTEEFTATIEAPLVSDPKPKTLED